MEQNGNEKILYIRLLGNFYMAYQGEPVILGKNINGKMLQLLLMLIYFRGEGVRREQLLEQLYPERDVEQASNSLRAMLYRLRKSLVAAGLPDTEYITTKGGVYRFQTEKLELELDTEEFQNKASVAMEETEDEAKILLLEETCRLYRGEFLPMMIGEEWVSVANWKFQELYFKCLRELARLLKKQKNYKKLLTYCEQALVKYPYEEWQMMKIECLTEMKEYKAAMEYYEQVMADFQKEFAMLPSEEMIQCFRSIKNMMQYEMNNIEDIQAQFQEKLAANGATRCDYLTFIDIYHYIVWVLERKGAHAQLVLFTIVDDDGVPLKTSVQLESARQALDRAINTSVRKSDLYTRYGKNQFLILMVDAEAAGCKLACERIRSRFQSLNGRKRINVYYTHQTVTDISDETIRKSIGLGLKKLDS